MNTNDDTEVDAQNQGDSNLDSEGNQETSPDTFAALGEGDGLSEKIESIADESDTANEGMGD